MARATNIPLFECKKTTVRRDGKLLWTTPSWKIESNESVVLLGESGSGKTTLLKILRGELLPREGFALINGTPFEDLRSSEQRAWRSSIGYVDQEASALLSYRTVIDNVALPMELNGYSEYEARQIASQTLKEVGIERRFFRRFPNQLSGGQRQRVAFAKAVAQRPKLILLDEPTSALDSENARLLVDYLFQKKPNGSAVVVVTHDPKLFVQRCNKVYLLHQGHIYNISDYRMNPKMRTFDTYADLYEDCRRQAEIKKKLDESKRKMEERKKQEAEKASGAPPREDQLRTTSSTSGGKPGSPISLSIPIPNNGGRPQSLSPQKPPQPPVVQGGYWGRTFPNSVTNCPPIN